MADLDDIWDYSGATWGPAKAEAYVSGIFECFARAVVAPETGRDRSVFVPGARSLKTGQHLVFYRRLGPDVVILRVVHERRNWAALSFADEQDLSHTRHRFFLEKYPIMQGAAPPPPVTQRSRVTSLPACGIKENVLTQSRTEKLCQLFPRLLAAKGATP